MGERSNEEDNVEEMNSSKDTEELDMNERDDNMLGKESDLIPFPIISTKPIQSNMNSVPERAQKNSSSGGEQKESFNAVNDTFTSRTEMENSSTESYNEDTEIDSSGNDGNSTGRQGASNRMEEEMSPYLQKASDANFDGDIHFSRERNTSMTFVDNRSSLGSKSSSTYTRGNEERSYTSYDYNGFNERINSDVLFTQYRIYFLNFGADVDHWPLDLFSNEKAKDDMKGFVIHNILLHFVLLMN